jgi:HPt (histidine-containing phosphotransfer) domain-containing protein
VIEDHVKGDRMDLQDLIKHMDFGKETNLEIIELFISTGRSDLAELEAAIKAADAGRAAAAAHSIKGASISLGLTGIHSRAGDIEERARSGSTLGIEASVQALAADLDEIVALSDVYRSQPQ